MLSTLSTLYGTVWLDTGVWWLRTVRRLIWDTAVGSAYHTLGLISLSLYFSCTWRNYHQSHPFMFVAMIKSKHAKVRLLLIGESDFPCYTCSWYFNRSACHSESIFWSCYVMKHCYVICEFKLTAVWLSSPYYSLFQHHSIQDSNSHSSCTLLSCMSWIHGRDRISLSNHPFI